MVECDRPFGIMFHHFHDEGAHIKGQGSVDAKQFERMLDYLSRTYNLLSAHEWYEKLMAGEATPKDICLTFDDALKCQYDIAYPVMKSRDITAFWFVYTSPLTGVKEKLEIYRYFRFKYFHDVEDFYGAFFNLLLGKKDFITEKDIGFINTYDFSNHLEDATFYTYNDRKFRYIRDKILGPEKYYALMDSMLEAFQCPIDEWDLWLNEGDIKTLHDNGHIVGLHSHTHPTDLAAFSFEKQKWEYETNQAIIGGITGKPITAMSYPCGSYNGDSVRILGNLGIDLAFNANMEPDDNSYFHVPRLDHAYLIKELGL